MVMVFIVSLTYTTVIFYSVYDMYGYAFHGAQVMYGGTLHGDLDISGSIFRGVPGNVYAAMV